MSLINDALKRASQVQPPPPDIKEGGAPLTPAQVQSGGIPWLWIGYGGALVLACILACWAVAVGYIANRELKRDRDHTVLARESSAALEAVRLGTAAARPPEAPSVATTAPPAPVSVGQPTNPGPVIPPGADPLGAPATSPGPPAAVPAPLKLQAIFYQPASPSALVNSKLVRRGDTVADARVVAISKESVTVARDGQTTVLTLP